MKRSKLVLFCLFILANAAYAQSWIQQQSGTTQILESIFMINESEGWAVGDAGTILHTVNGGANWVQVNATVQDLQDVAFRNSQTGIIAGDAGLILRTTNGGLNWNPVVSGTGANLAAVAWATDNIVFISGRDGAALLSVNAGVSWTLLNTGSSLRYRGANAFNNKLWAVGENGVIIHSGNNGTSWQGQPNPATNDLHDIQFLTENNGFAGGSNSLIIHTSNSGSTWTSRSAGINFGINGIWFLDESMGYAASDGGIIYFTNNGGINWLSQPTGLNVKINEVHFPVTSKGWAVGENGTIFFLDNGVPVELTGFTGIVSGSTVKLTWSTSTETNNFGFEIQKRGSVDQNWSTSGFVKGSGSSTTPKAYSFSENISAPGKYNYRLKQINHDGSSELYYLKNEITISLVNNFELHQNYPNPFNPSTKIEFSTAQSGVVSLKVYNILGKEVATLLNSFKEGGKHSINFNAENLPAGIYMYKIESGNLTQVRKMTLLK